MHILRAYCVEVGRILDVYQARALFFAQEEPRHRFQFQCSDDACRAETATKVTAVNYDKLVAEGDQIVLKPHFRMNPRSPHVEACEWVARERSSGLREAPDANERKPNQVGFRHLKRSDLLDIYVQDLPPASAASRARDGAPRAQLADIERRWSEEPGVRRKGSDNYTRTSSLEALVTVYELLEPSERRAVKLRVGAAKRLPYSKAFCRVEHYFSARGDRIFHGGVRVRNHGPNFTVRFFDQVRRADAVGNNEALEVTFYLKRAVLLEHWNGKFLVAQLTEAALAGHYAHCYFFGRLVPHRTSRCRLVVEVKSLDHLAFTLRAKGLTQHRLS